MNQADYISKMQLMYRDNAEQAQEHRKRGHNMVVSTLEAIAATQNVVSLDCECGESFAMPFIQQRML